MPPVSAKEWMRAHPEFRINPKPSIPVAESPEVSDARIVESIANPYARLDDLLRMREDLEELKGLLKESLQRNAAMEGRISQQDGQIRSLNEQLKKVALEMARPQAGVMPKPPMGGFFGSLLNPAKLAEALKIPAFKFPGPLPSVTLTQTDQQPSPRAPLSSEAPKPSDADDGDYEDDETQSKVGAPVDYSKQVKSLDEILGKYNYYKLP